MVMPTTYAHDLFGKEVYRRLPSDMKALIRRHGDLYRIGLHGPDVLFYYMISKNPVTQFGISMHQEKARAFFEEGMRQVRRNKDEALLSYLLGFGCHYMLDPACHPYVNQMAKEGIVPHIVLEKEFDRVLMEENGKDPDHYYPACGIIPKMEYARVIHRAIPLVKTVNIYISIKMMKFLTNFMVCDDHGRKRRIIGRLLGLGGRSIGSLIEHFMTEGAVEEAKALMPELERLYREAIPETVEYLKELYTLREGAYHLSARWNCTYNG